MAQRMACEAADLIRAAVSVSYPLNRETCSPARPIGMWEIAGTADTTISDVTATPRRWDCPTTLAGIPLGVQGARASLAAWKRILGCSDDLSREQLPDGSHYAGSRFEEYRNCNGGVRTGLVSIANGGTSSTTAIPSWAAIPTRRRSTSPPISGTISSTSDRRAAGRRVARQPIADPKERSCSNRPTAADAADAFTLRAAPSAAIRPTKWGVIWLLTLTLFSALTVGGLLSPLQEAVKAELHLTDLDIGLLAGGGDRDPDRAAVAADRLAGGSQHAHAPADHSRLLLGDRDDRDGLCPELRRAVRRAADCRNRRGHGVPGADLLLADVCMPDRRGRSMLLVVDRRLGRRGGGVCDRRLAVRLSDQPSGCRPARHDAVARSPSAGGRRRGARGAAALPHQGAAALRSGADQRFAALGDGRLLAASQVPGPAARRAVDRRHGRGRGGDLDGIAAHPPIWSGARFVRRLVVA